MSKTPYRFRQTITGKLVLQYGHKVGSDDSKHNYYQWIDAKVQDISAELLKAVINE